MTTQTEALNVALDALRNSQDYKMGRAITVEAVELIEESLAQPEQEPVATLDDLEQEIYENTRQFVSRDVMEWMLKRYYTTPPQRKPHPDCDSGCMYVCTEGGQRLPKCEQRKPLTDEQIVPMFSERQKQQTEGEKDAWYFYAWGVSDGEAVHGIKE